jgi:mRNA interferase MazF
MSKPFAQWNENKIMIHDAGKHKLYHARDIWWCTLGVNVGFEQDGTGKEYQRPVIILKGFSKQVCLIIPLTTSQKSNPYHIHLGMVDGKDASAIISQLRLIDTKRLINKIGVVDKGLFETIKKAVKSLF